ncbi:DUF29 family protein [Planktothrix sp. FACHB-1355]|uniref:DUF29 family protein n=1 Tax=Aerosakkonema funiforme FACHB-1375 TaxID=2949571 RepID=A0A926ZHU6_9CYAN|nr:MULTISPECIES: DUF29 family protein [Oscillatoriales]MBD2183683.1 DUF29 family protein [Aerosakkonema funiforme FACHB-1375]MBD3563004.1 DUF29 family protein [Planktothrix sp. FACHB-1355]
MTQELTDLRNYILEKRYEDALILIDELEGMSRQAILRNIQSFLDMMMMHLIKNQIEQGLTNSWIASISDSIVQIKRLNLKENKTSYYVKADEWELMLEEAIASSIRPASAELLNGKLKPSQVSQMLDNAKLMAKAKQLLALTYEYSATDLPDIIDEYLIELPGGQDWLEDR